MAYSGITGLLVRTVRLNLDSMAEVAAMAERGTAGWFYVDGDPAGTVRRWNGYEWIGFPTLDPALGYQGGATRASRLSRRGAWLARTAMATLAVLGSLFAYAAWQIFRGLEQTGFESPLGSEIRSGDASSYVDNLGLIVTAIAIAVVVCAITFIPWLREIAPLAGANRRRRTRGSTTKPKRSTAAIVLQVWLFGLLAPLFWGLRAIGRGIAGSATGGGGGIFELVQDSAMWAGSTDHGPSDISPIKIMAWWFLWWLPLVVMLGAWIRLGWISPVAASTMRTTLQLTGIMLVLEVISVLCIMTTITQITNRLARR